MTIRCSVGITAHNEEANIGQLLDAMLSQELSQVEIGEIIVVASGCTDRTTEIVREYAKRDSRIRLLRSWVCCTTGTPVVHPVPLSVGVAVRWARGSVSPASFLPTGP